MAAEPVQEVQQVVGVLAGGIQADDEADRRVACGDLLEALVEPGLAVGRLGERQLGGGGLLILTQEGAVVAVARGVDADPDADGWAGGLLRSGD
jgi:hypothetical protein